MAEHTRRLLFNARIELDVAIAQMQPKLDDEIICAHVKLAKQYLDEIWEQTND